MPPIVTSILRTAVPVVWAALITYLVEKLGLPPVLSGILVGLDPEVLTLALVSVLTTVWYAAARWLESQTWWPMLLRRLALGSAQTPEYDRGDHDVREGSKSVAELQGELVREARNPVEETAAMPAVERGGV
jgi:hypothetical protein